MPQKPTPPRDTSITPNAAQPGDAADAVNGLVKLLDIQQIDENRFRGASSATSWGRVYGGQVLAQALVAAIRTAPPERRAHSLHAYFLLAGLPDKPIDYQVDRLRDGGSFSTRRVTALQDGQPIFASIASFQIDEQGYTHQLAMPDVPAPESLEAFGAFLARADAQVPETMRAYYARRRPFDLRLVETGRYTGSAVRVGGQHMWMKLLTPLPDDPSLHTALLTYASDFAMIDTALIPHGRMMFDPGMQLASLDHALWLHRPVKVDEWLLYALESPAAGGARGLARGAFYSRDGRLLASVAQEGLMRAKSTAFVIK